MKTARQVREEVRAEEKRRRQLRLEAVLAVVAAGSAASRELEAAERRKQALREQFERDLAAEDAKIDAKELAAGRCVVEALSGAGLDAIGATFRDTELQKRTGIQLAVLRRWAKRAREAGEQTSGGGGSTGAALPEPSGAPGGERRLESAGRGVVEAPVSAVGLDGRG
ncbi:hypothetical protein [Lentzea jiangxiensis]|uniref:hypothetical protein n=1 Tax=Lentzea jiangxiensis TaxID=641025 RepID=UPI00115FED61|nr:hypothetical protein [Lentzea jiangxiensis]